ATRAYGGEVVQSADMLATVEELRRARDLTLVHPFDDPRIIAGAGSVADEVFDELPEADAIVCGVGGGGLVAGLAVVVRARRPAARVIGVEPDDASSMRQSLDAGHAVRLAARPTTVADGLAAPYAGEVTYPHVRELGVEICTVPDAAIVDAMFLLLERAKVVAEPAAAAGIAALLGGMPRPALVPGSTVVCVISGGNVDRDRLRALA
ncbi:MAG TPA: pyridoxal-phosphate dependent enzyme, partial [Gemmatimonadaceae bacterium]|nr:pyridoxal-phosphate dependent enzyme [Gemmatimonadaceae bacterium]